jgi:hypothetical protein
MKRVAQRGSRPTQFAAELGAEVRQRVSIVRVESSPGRGLAERDIRGIRHFGLRSSAF